jgi:Asp-tRNA(Asn)/Glu-tRNA(Gln) amidotransferase A subunit family amidase
MNSLKEIDDIYCYPAWKIAQAINSEQVSATEVSKIFIDRIDLLNPKLKAWKSLNQNYVIDQAKRVGLNRKNTPLNGVPVGVKDIFNTEVFPTERGSPIWKGYMAGNDARCVSYLKDQGCIIMGKTDTAEFAVHHPGDCLNPWDIHRTTGTSSGGSAVAVASAMTPIALATQTAGSTIRPASWCGVYGMKPSFGLIPRTGVLKTTDTLDNIGFYGRDNNDLKLILDSLRVHGSNFPTMQRKLKEYSKPIKRWKVGYIKGHLWESAPDYVHHDIQNFSADLDSIDCIDIVEIDLPDITRNAHELHSRVYDPCLSYYFQRELEKAPEKISDAFLEQVQRGREYSPEDYKFALDEQSTLANTIESFFQNNEIDLFLHYSSNGSAPIVEPKINLDLNLLWTLSWLPVVSIPQFFCPKGLPFGLQLIGPRYSDYQMFEFMKLLVESGRIPSVAKLAP